MFLCMMAFFLKLVAIPQIVLDNVCLLKHNKTKCRAMFTGSHKEDFDAVQQESTLWFGGYLVTTTLVTVLCLPFVGTMSDRFGRYKAMLSSPISQLLQTFVFLGILAKDLNFPTWTLLLAGPITAFVGDVGGLYVLTASYVAEITTEKERTLRLTLLESSQLTGALAATIFSGLIIEKLGYSAIFIADLILLILALAYLIFCVKPVEHLKEATMQEEEKEPVKKDKEPTETTKNKGLGIISNQMTEIGKNKNEFENDDEDASESHRTKMASVQINHAVTKSNSCEEFGRDVTSLDINRNELHKSEDESTGNPNLTAENRHSANANTNVRVHIVEPDETKLRGAGESEELHSKDNKCKSENGETGAVRDQRDNNKTIENDLFSSKYERKLSVENKTQLKIDSNENTGNVNDNEDQKVKDAKISLQIGSSEANDKKKSAFASIMNLIRESNPIKNLIRAQKILKENEQLSCGLLLFLLMSLAAISYSGELAVTALYLKNKPYYLPATDLGYFLAYESGMLAILGMVILNFLFTKVMKIQDHVLLIFNSVAYIVYFVLLALAKSMLMLYLIQPIRAAGTLNTCAIKSILTKSVPEASVGLLLGALLMIETFSVMIGALVCPIIYSTVAATNPGAVFYVNVGLMIISTPVAGYLLFIKKKDEQNLVQKAIANECNTY